MTIDPLQVLVHRYADAVSRRDVAQWTSCWADDASWLLAPDREAHGKQQIVELFDRSMGNLVAAVQLVANGEATVEGDHARGRWYIHEYTRRVSGAHTLLLGYYDDEYRLIGDQWRFARRALSRLYQGPPDLSGDFTALHESRTP